MTGPSRAGPASPARRVGPEAMRGTLARVAAAGGFFTLVVGGEGAVPPEAEGWRTAAALYSPAPGAGAGGASGAAAGMIDLIADRLGAPERRVAASIAHLGYAARVWSVVLGAAVTDGRVPELDPDDLWWRQAPSGAIELRVDRSAGHEVGPGGPPGVRVAALADLAYRAVVERHLVPLGAAVHAQVAISDKILWGNAASALVGTSRMLESEPAGAETARSLAAALLDRGPLRGTGTTSGPGQEFAPASFVRRSCCLFYRIPGGGTCGDCVLIAAAAAR